MDSWSDPTQFDPLKLPDWSFPMTIAWISWSSLEKVTLYSDEYRQNVNSRQPGAYPRRASYFELQRASAKASTRPEPPQKEIPDAKGKLWSALQFNQLQATAFDPTSGSWRTINADEFRDLEVIEDTRGRDRLSRKSPCRQRTKAVYLYPHVRRADVLRIWSPTWIEGDDPPDWLIDADAAALPPMPADISRRQSTQSKGVETKPDDQVAPQKEGPGAKRQFDRLAGKKEAFRLLDYHGDLTPDDPKWNSKAKLISALQDFYQKKYRRVPAYQTLQPFVDDWLAGYRVKRPPR